MLELFLKNIKDVENFITKSLQIDITKYNWWHLRSVCFDIKYFQKNIFPFYCVYFAIKYSKVKYFQSTKSARQIYVKYFTLKILVKYFTFVLKLSLRYFLSLTRQSLSHSLLSHSQVLPPHKLEPPSYSQVRQRHSSLAALIAYSTSTIIGFTPPPTDSWFDHSNPPILFLVRPYTGSNSTNSIVLHHTKSTFTFVNSPTGSQI